MPIYGLTLKDIEKKEIISISKIKKLSGLISNIVPQVLDFAKEYQIGRVNKELTSVKFDFTEGWFRTSGLYDLEEKYQLQCLHAFIENKCRWSKSKLQSETAKYKQWQEFLEISRKKVMEQEKIEGLIEIIENGAFKTKDQLLQKIADFGNDKLSPPGTLTQILQRDKLSLSKRC